MTGPLGFFLSADPGQRYGLFHSHRGPLRGRVLYIHPFAEEINKTRRMAALQSRALADAGYAVLQVDLLGCGDSSGDFDDARWAIWIDDLLTACRWLARQSPETHAPLWLWGLRAGCLLAADVARQLAAPCHQLWWQPFASGALQLQQFMRLRLAADMLAGPGHQATGAMEALRQRLAHGDTLEIAGYPLAPALAKGLEAARLDAFAPVGDEPARLAWLETSPGDTPQLGAAASRTLAAWEASGWQTEGHAVQGPAFWQSAETEEAPHLLAATLRVMAEGRPA